MIDRFKDVCLVLAVLTSMAVGSCPGVIAFAAGLLVAGLVAYSLPYLSPYR